MINDLADLIQQTSKNRSLIDKYFVLNLNSIIISSLKLNDYVDYVTFTKNGNFLGRYCYPDKYVVYNLDNLELQAQYIFNKYAPFFYDYGLNYLKCFIILNIVSHELIHADNYKYSMNNDDIESFILKNSEFSTLIKKYDDNLFNEKQNNTISISKKINRLIYLKRLLNKKEMIYKKFGECSPDERIAEFEASDICGNVANSLNCNKIKEFYDFKKIYVLLREYENLKKYTCPTELYLKKINNNIDWKMIEEQSEGIDCFERLRLGLKLNDDETFNMADRCIKILKKYNID